MHRSGAIPAIAPDPTGVSDDGPASVEPGPLAVPFFAAGDDAPWVEIQVPARWGLDRIHLVTGPGPRPHLRRIEWSTVAMVAPDPCEKSLATTFATLRFVAAPTS